MNTVKFNPRELCSRKLWQLVSTAPSEPVSTGELQEAIAELAARRHYLDQLQQIGALQGMRSGA
ncbi:MAG: hypothetical protein KDI05_01780 [Halieaceae bacterium]|nr:hypothetical protein [Halieaceae bacterium]